MNEGDRFDVGGVIVRLKVSRRARRVSLRIDPVKGEAVAVAPNKGRLSAALSFAQAHRNWARRRLETARSPWPLEPGGRLSLFGQSCRLSPDGRNPEILPGADGLVLRGCGEGQVDARLAVSGMKSWAQSWFARRLAVHARSLGVATPQLKLSEALSRWGSCAPARKGSAAVVRINWRLALAPPTVADYVA
ncbi:MAG: M48 family metallopeptidase, partial [Caulobacteraceae bacterium]